MGWGPGMDFVSLLPEMAQDDQLPQAPADDTPDTVAWTTELQVKINGPKISPCCQMCCYSGKTSSSDRYQCPPETNAHGP